MGDAIEFLESFHEGYTAAEDCSLIAAAGNFAVKHGEVKGEVMDWVLNYLELKGCPLHLAVHLAGRVSCQIAASIQNDLQQNGEEGKTDNGPSVQSGSLYAECLNVLRELCSIFLEQPAEVEMLTSLENAPPFSSSVFAIKNKRRKMEDRHIVIHDLNALMNLKCTSMHSYYAVFDGHAGIEAATYASSQLHVQMVEHPCFMSDTTKAIREAYKMTDVQFCDRALSQGVKSGCTAVSALIRDSTLYIAWLGDSQALLVRQGEPIELVIPHKPDRQDERERIEALGGYVLLLGTWRVNGTLAVSRALGDHEFKPYISSEPEMKVVDLDGTEDFLILACDGLWDGMSPEDVSCMIYRNLVENPKMNPKTDLAEQLVHQSKIQGSDDNITVIIIFLRNIADIIADAPKYARVPDILNGRTYCVGDDPYLELNAQVSPLERPKDLQDIQSFPSLNTASVNVVGMEGKSMAFGLPPEATALSELPTPPIDDIPSKQAFPEFPTEEELEQLQSGLADSQFASQTNDLIENLKTQELKSNHPQDDIAYEYNSVSNYTSELNTQEFYTTEVSSNSPIQTGLTVKDLTPADVMGVASDVVINTIESAKVYVESSEESTNPVALALNSPLNPNAEPFVMKNFSPKETQNFDFQSTEKEFQDVIEKFETDLHEKHEQNYLSDVNQCNTEVAKEHENIPSDIQQGISDHNLCINAIDEPQLSPQSDEMNESKPMTPEQVLNEQLSNVLEAEDIQKPDLSTPAYPDDLQIKTASSQFSPKVESLDAFKFSDAIPSGTMRQDDIYVEKIPEQLNIVDTSPQGEPLELGVPLYVGVPSEPGASPYEPVDAYKLSEDDSSPQSPIKDFQQDIPETLIPNPGEGALSHMPEDILHMAHEENAHLNTLDKDDTLLHKSVEEAVPSYKHLEEDIMFQKPFEDILSYQSVNEDKLLDEQDRLADDLLLNKTDEDIPLYNKANEDILLNKADDEDILLHKSVEEDLSSHDSLKGDISPYSNEANLLLGNEDPAETLAYHSTDISYEHNIQTSIVTELSNIAVNSEISFDDVPVENKITPDSEPVENISNVLLNSDIPHDSFHNEISGTHLNDIPSYIHNEIAAYNSVNEPPSYDSEILEIHSNTVSQELSIEQEKYVIDVEEKAYEREQRFPVSEGEKNVIDMLEQDIAATNTADNLENMSSIVCDGQVPGNEDSLANIQPSIDSGISPEIIDNEQLLKDNLQPAEEVLLQDNLLLAEEEVIMAKSVISDESVKEGQDDLLKAEKPTETSAGEELQAMAVDLTSVPDGIPEAEGVCEDVDSDSEKDGGWSYVKATDSVTADSTPKEEIAKSKKVAEKKIQSSQVKAKKETPKIASKEPSKITKDLSKPKAPSTSEKTKKPLSERKALEQKDKNIVATTKASVTPKTMQKPVKTAAPPKAAPSKPRETTTDGSKPQVVRQTVSKTVTATTKTLTKSTVSKMAQPRTQVTTTTAVKTNHTATTTTASKAKELSSTGAIKPSAATKPRVASTLPSSKITTNAATKTQVPKKPTTVFKKPEPKEIKNTTNKQISAEKNVVGKPAVSDKTAPSMRKPVMSSTPKPASVTRKDITSSTTKPSVTAIKPSTGKPTMPRSTFDPAKKLHVGLKAPTASMKTDGTKFTKGKKEISATKKVGEQKTKSKVAANTPEEMNGEKFRLEANAKEDGVQNAVAEQNSVPECTPINAEVA